MTMKPVAKWVVRVLGVLVVLVLVLLLGLRVWGAVWLQRAESAFKEKIGPLELKAWEIAAVPDEANAAIPIRAGALGVVLSKEEVTFVGELTTRPVTAWRPEEVTRLKGIVANNAGALELMHRATALERSSFGTGLEWDGDLEGQAPLLRIIRTARLLVDRARLGWSLGEREEALRSVETLGAIARVCETENLLIAQLIGVAVERMAFVVVAEIVASPSASEAEIARVAAALPRVDLRRAWVRTVATETLTFRDGLATNRSRYGRQERGTLRRAGIWALRSLQAAPAFEVASGRASLVDQPAGQASDPKTWPIAKSGWFDLEKYASLPGKAAVRYQATLAGRMLWRAAVELRSRSAASGAYPESLTTLPDAERPDALTGDPLSYQRRQDGSAVVSVPRGVEVYDSINEIKSFAPFTWELPAPAPITVRR